MSRHEPDDDRDGSPAVSVSLGKAVYNVVWSVLALEVVVLLAHLAASMLFAVNDGRAILASVLGFSLFLWTVASLIVAPMVFSALLRRLAESSQGREPDPLHDDWIDA